MRLILLWLLNACALLAVAYLMPASIQLASFAGTAMIAAVLLGLVNAALRPLLVLLTLPVTLLSFGLFLFVVNGLMFWLAGSLLEGFVVSGFWPGVFGAIAVQHHLVDTFFPVDHPQGLVMFSS
jgi:putative membrane protein